MGKNKSYCCCRKFNKKIQYAVIDKHPNNGANYLRIKQVDYDGHTTYYGKVFIDFSYDAKSIISPNPFLDKLNINNLTPDENTSIQVYNITLDLIKEISPTGKESLFIDLSHLESGVYYVKIINNK